jgi:hypothetical protein
MEYRKKQIRFYLILSPTHVTYTQGQSTSVVDIKHKLVIF